MNIGDKYKLYFNEHNTNNTILELRGIIDDKMLIFKTPKGNYRMEPIEFFEFHIEKGTLTKI